MADQGQVNLLTHDVEAWNTLRHLGKIVAIDLREANLFGADLTDANLSHAKLIGADLTGANMDGAIQ
jgi:uncharacterized protein YjbI with pentapeptide repeats